MTSPPCCSTARETCAGTPTRPPGNVRSATRPAPRRVRHCRHKLDVALFTPGEPTGRPLALPVVPPGFDQLPEADRERFAQYAAAALGSMIGFKSSDRRQGAAGDPGEGHRDAGRSARGGDHCARPAGCDRATGRRAA